MDSHKPQAKLVPSRHAPGTRFLAVASFGFTNTMQECVVMEWAPSGLYVHLKFPLANKSDWFPVASFDIVEVLHETNKARTPVGKAPRKPGAAA
jgi:hypothetical protein